MRQIKKDIKRHLSFLLLFCLSTMISFSHGISVDAGLTPAQDRWIFRTQLRYLSFGNLASMNRQMEMYMVPVVLAYGLKSNLTLLVKQPILMREMSMMGTNNSNSGFGDFFLMGKFKIYRQNTERYTLGMATTLGMEAPTGSSDFSSRTWDLKPGLYFSWRTGGLGSDISVAYTWNGFAGKGRNNVIPGNEFAFDWAASYQFSLGGSSRMSIAPVLEVSYRDFSFDRADSVDIANSGGSILFVSPGIKYISTVFVLEALVLIPVWQKQNGNQLKRNSTLLIGLRYLF